MIKERDYDMRNIYLYQMFIYAIVTLHEIETGVFWKNSLHFGSDTDLHLSTEQNLPKDHFAVRIGNRYYIYERMN